eukprot:690196-Alexandrium_andersonii.AAC.1
MQSAIRSRPVRAAIRLNPRSALRNVQNGLKRSELEPRGRNSGINIGPKSSRGLRPAELFVHIPNLPTGPAIEG